MIKKKDQFSNLINKSDMFICTFCKDLLKSEGAFLVCKNNHTFNIAKQGYAMVGNFYKNYQDEHYNSELFEARKKVFELGFFDNVIEGVSQEINKYSDIKNIFDFGCGEGSFLNTLKNNLQKYYEYWGIDLSKDAIKLATNYLFNDIGFFVASLNDLPIKDNSVDCIVNILSPIFSAETKRVLSKNGIVIKVIPNKDYLREIRSIYNIATYESQADVLSNLNEKYHILKESDIIYDFKNTDELFKELLKMTPLMSEVDDTKANIILPDSVHVSLKLLVLKPRIL